VVVDCFNEIILIKLGLAHGIVTCVWGLELGRSCFNRFISYLYAVIKSFLGVKRPDTYHALVDLCPVD